MQSHDLRIISHHKKQRDRESVNAFCYILTRYKKQANPTCFIIFDFFRSPPTALFTINLWTTVGHLEIWKPLWSSNSLYLVARVKLMLFTKGKKWDVCFFHDTPWPRGIFLKSFACGMQSSHLGSCLCELWDFSVLIKCTQGLRGKTSYNVFRCNLTSLKSKRPRIYKLAFMKN